MFTTKDHFIERLHQVAKNARQGYWKDMYNLHDLRLYCPNFCHVNDLLSHAFYFHDDDGGELHPPTIVLLGEEGIYVQEADGSYLYKFFWKNDEAAFRYIKKATGITST